MASKYWLKLYHEILDDQKVMMLSPALRWRFIECLLVAGESDEGGQLPSTERYAWRVRSDVKTVAAELGELAAAGLISDEGDGWHVDRFAERQEADSDTERWRRWKERNRKKPSRNGSHHEDKTKPNETANEDQTANKRAANETFVDIDIDKDIDKIRSDCPTRKETKKIKPKTKNETAASADQVAELIELWCHHISRGAPLNHTTLLIHYERPAKLILKAHGYDVAAAFDFLKMKRAEFMKGGRAAFQLSDYLEVEAVTV